jgi:hypothetical protein
MSAVRYLADYSFHFYPDKVQRLLRKAGLAAAPAAAATSQPTAEPTSKPPSAEAIGGAIVVLPVYEDGAKAVLWEDPNPWREAWSEYSDADGSGPAPLIVPLGDAGDLAAIDAPRAEVGRPDALAAVARHNGGGAVVVALARLRREADGIAGLDMGISEYRDGRLVGRSDASLNAAPGEDPAALLRRAMTACVRAIAQVQAAARSSPASGTGSGSQQGSLAAVVPITSLGDWIAMRQRLAAVPAIRSIDLLSLNREEARVRLSYVGSPDQLKLALAAADLALDGGGPVWRLRPTGAALP